MLIDVVCYRSQRFDLPHGHVRLWDCGNGWTEVMEVNLPREDRRAFAEQVQFYLRPVYIPTRGRE